MKVLLNKILAFLNSCTSICLLSSKKFFSLKPIKYLCQLLFMIVPIRSVTFNLR